MASGSEMASSLGATAEHRDDHGCGGVQVLATSREWGEHDSAGSVSCSSPKRSHSGRHLRICSESGEVTPLGVAGQGLQIIATSSEWDGVDDSSDDGDGPRVRRKSTGPSESADMNELQVRSAENEWAALEDDTSSEEDDDEPSVINRHDRYARLARELEAKASAERDQADRPSEAPSMLGRFSLSYAGRYAAFTFPFFSYVSVDIALVHAVVHCEGSSWRFLFLIPPCLYLKSVEVAMAWTDPQAVQLRRVMSQQSRLVRIAIFRLATVGLMGCLYLYRLLLAHRRAAKQKRTFLLELEALDASRQHLVDEVRWDNDDLLWGPFVVVGLVQLLVNGSCHAGPLGLPQALGWTFFLLLAMFSVIIAAVNFDYGASHNIRTQYGMIYDEFRWVKCTRTNNREKQAEAQHCVCRTLEVIGRVLVLVVGALASAQYAWWLVAALHVMDYLIVTVRACFVCRFSLEVVLLSVPSFIVDLSRYVDEPGFALPARRLSRTIGVLRLVELLTAAGLLACWLFSGSEAQLAGFSLDRAACAALLGLLLTVHVGFFAICQRCEVCRPRGDLFTFVLDRDLKGIEWSLSFEGGCTVNMKVCANSRQTALHLAAENGLLDCAQLLLGKGADPAALDVNRDNVLHIACRRGDQKFAELLLAKPRSGRERCASAPAGSETVSSCLSIEDTVCKRLLEQMNEQTDRPVDVICDKRAPCLKELLEDRQEHLRTLVVPRRGGVRRHTASLIDRRLPPKLESATSSGASESLVSSACNLVEPRGSIRASIFGNVLGGEHFHLEAGPRAQVGRLDLAHFMCKRSMGEQFERLIENLHSYLHQSAYGLDPENSPICLSYLRTVSTLGAGGFGKVLKVEDLRSGEFYAMKLQKKDKATKQAIREARALHTCKHRFIVELKRIFHTTVVWGIVMEFCEMDLNMRILHEVSGERSADGAVGLPAGVAGRYTACVMMALEHLHQRNVMFRDLKPENVLITSKERGDLAKLADFGMARSLDKILSEYVGKDGTPTPSTARSPGSGMNKRLTIKAGTLAFMSREAMEDADAQASDGHDMKWFASRDWYGLGCCVLLMLLSEQGGRKIPHGRRHVLLPAPQDEILKTALEAMERDLIDEDAFDLVTSLTAANVKDRWAAQELRRSPFLRAALLELDPEGLPPVAAGPTGNLAHEKK